MSYSICINGCCVLAVSNALLPAIKHDVLNAMLFAQRAADEDFPEDASGSDWIDVYKDTLSACGWDFYEEKVITRKTSSLGGKAFFLREALRAVFENNMTEHQVAVLLAALDKVAELPDTSSAALILREQTVLSLEGQKRIRTWIGVIDENGSLKIASVVFDTRGSVDKLFSEGKFAFSDLVGAMKANFYAAHFNVGIYSESREDIAQWLEARLQPECLEIANLMI